MIAGVVGAKRWYERDAKDSIVQVLGEKLSPGASVILKDEDGFKEKTKRWQAWASPHISAVVDVQSEEDVRESVGIYSHLYVSRSKMLKHVGPLRNQELHPFPPPFRVPRRNHRTRYRQKCPPSQPPRPGLRFTV